jgi:ABC-type branched-subunit amino acid transport system ATPase component
MTTKAPALELRGLHSGYGEAMVVHGVNLTIHPGEILALLGKNGMGKTTLLKTIMGFLPAAKGSIHVFGDDVRGRPPYVLARQGISYTPQEQPLFADLSVAENLRLGLRDDRGFDEGLERVTAFFPFVRERLRQRAGTLSGGEQKMLLMSRALIARPRLMLVDEITEGLQPSVVQRLSAVLRAQREERGTAILLVEQNVRFALRTADRFAVLNRGEVVEGGRVDDPEAEQNVTRHLRV